MAYSALFQGHPVRFTGPEDGSASCSLMLDDVMRVLADAGVVLTAPLAKTSPTGDVPFGTLLHWLETTRTAGGSEVEMFLHWLLRHMPTAQAALGLPLAGYLQNAAPSLQVKRQAA
jgi:hypothetical protein